MSVREFDDYLTVLRGMLRLGSSRREAIASELRDHLDERVAELVQQGLSERDAVRMAIEEFGDAAVLAADFLTVFRNSKKRWLMRTTAISLCAAAVVAVAWITLWPGDERELVVKQAAAQSEGEVGGGTVGTGGGGVDESGGGSSGTIAAEGGVGETGGPGASGGPGFGGGLGGPAGGGGLLQEAPLTVAQRNTQTEEALAKRVDVTLESVPLTEFLKYLGETFGVASYIDRKGLEDAGLGSDIPVGNLSLEHVRGDMLLDLVLKELELGYLVRDGIVIVTTPERLEDQQEVRIYNCRDLLGMAGGFGGAMGGMGSMSGGGDMMSGSAGMMGSGMGMPGMGGMGSMGAGAGGMGMAGMSGMGGAGMGLGGGLGDGSGGEGASGGMSAPGGATPGMGMGMSGGMPGGIGPGGASGGGGSAKRLYENPKAAHLINILETVINPETWEEVGGPGSIGEYNGLLIVNQTAPIHEKIEKVLDMLREADQKQPGAAVRGSR